MPGPYACYLSCLVPGGYIGAGAAVALVGKGDILGVSTGELDTGTELFTVEPINKRKQMRMVWYFTSPFNIIYHIHLNYCKCSYKRTVR